MSNEKSQLPTIVVPDFKPLIPEYMLDGIKDDSTKYIVEQLSIMTQQGQWQTHKILNIHDYTKKINGKVIELDQFRNELLTQMTVEEELDRQEKAGGTTRTRVYFAFGAVLALIVYPMYMLLMDKTGLGSILRALLTP